MAVAYSPLFAALFFFVSTILRLISYMQFINRSFYNENDLKELNPIYVEQQWQYRRDNYPLIAGANVLNAVAWVLFAIPILQVSWILSRGGQRKMRTHGVIVGFALTGIITELIARFLLFGGRSTAVWVSTTFNLDVWLPPNISDQPDFIGWRALEVTYIIITGLVTFVDSFEWVCLFIILTLIAYSVSSMQNPALNIWWARFGLLVAFLCLFDLVGAVILLYDEHTYTRFAVGISAINMGIFLPSWLTILAFQLPKALPNYVPARDTELTRLH